jgi:hypothetical protein
VVPCAGAFNCYLDGEALGVLSTSNASYAPAYAATSGWDFATGIGSVNAFNLVNAFVASVLPAAPVLVSPANGATGVSQGSALSWDASAEATSYNVYFGTVNPPPLVMNTSNITYATGTLSPGVTYYWKVAAKDLEGATSSAVWSFTTASGVGSSACSIAVDRGGMWYVDSNHDFQYDVGDSSYGFGLGLAGAAAAVGPWHTSAPNWLGVFLNGTWYVDTNGTNAYTAGDASYSFGFPGAYPVVGDWTASGVLRIGVFLNGVWYVDTNNDHTFDTGDQTLSYGITGDYPVLGDWTHTGIRRIGVYRGNGLWIEDTNGDNVFDIGDQMYSFGFAGAIPVVGDWTGNGVDKIGVFDPGSGNWYLDLNGNNVYDPGEGPFQFGLAGDLPAVICSKYN